MNQQILDSIKKTLATSLPQRATAMLYGSQARGDARRDSDWDILIVLDKDKLVPHDYDTVTYPLTKLGWELGTEINLGSILSSLASLKSKHPIRIGCLRKAFILMSVVSKRIKGNLP